MLKVCLKQFPYKSNIKPCWRCSPSEPGSSTLNHDHVELSPQTRAGLCSASMVHLKGKQHVILSLCHSPIVLVSSNMFSRVEEAICCHDFATFPLYSLNHCVFFNYFLFQTSFMSVCVYFHCIRKYIKVFDWLSKAGLHVSDTF